MSYSMGQVPKRQGPYGPDLPSSPSDWFPDVTDPELWGEVDWDRLQGDLEQLQSGDMSNEEFWKNAGVSADVLCVVPGLSSLVFYACVTREIMKDAHPPDWFSEQAYGMSFDQYCAKIGGRLQNHNEISPHMVRKRVDCVGGDPSLVEPPILPPCAYTADGCPEEPPHKLEIEGACPEGMHKEWGPDGTETCAFDEPTPRTQCPSGCEHAVHPTTGAELCIGGPCASKPTVHPPTPQGRAAYEQMSHQVAPAAASKTPLWLILGAALVAGMVVAAATEGG